MNDDPLRKYILRFIQTSPNSLYNCRNPRGIRRLTRSRLGLSHLYYHKFKYNFQDSLNPPLCMCGQIEESTTHFLIYCPLFLAKRAVLGSKLTEINSDLLEMTDSSLSSSFCEIQSLTHHPTCSV